MHGSGQETYEALVEDAEKTDLKWNTVFDGGLRPPSLFFTHAVNCSEKQNISCKCNYGSMNCAEMARLHLTISDISPSSIGKHSIQKLSTHEMDGLTTLASSLGITASDKYSNAAKPRVLLIRTGTVSTVMREKSSDTRFTTGLNREHIHSILFLLSLTTKMIYRGIQRSHRLDHKIAHQIQIRIAW